MIHADWGAIIVGAISIIGTLAVTIWSWWVSRDMEEPRPPEGDQGSE